VQVNYVTGDNGSGKSAILTGIQLGLGSKANLTGRASSAKGKQYRTDRDTLTGKKY